MAEWERGAARVVWYRDGVAAEECPVSLVKPEQVRWLEEWGAGLEPGDARGWEARRVLEEERGRRDG